MLQCCFKFMFFIFSLETCEILAAQPGIESSPPCIRRWSLNHWVIREVPEMDLNDTDEWIFFFFMPGMLYYSKGKLLALITAKMAVCPISRYFHLEQPLLLPWRWFYPIAGKGLSCLCLGLIYILFRESSQGYGHVFASTVASHKPHRTLGWQLRDFPHI